MSRRPHLAVLAACLAMSACAVVPTTAPAPPVVAPHTPLPTIPPDANPDVGGATLAPDRTIAANLPTAPTLSMLWRAVQAAGLAPTLDAAGPVTLFAPTDEAFARLAPGIADQLLQPQNRATLTRLLRYHLVAGRLTSADLAARIRAGGGSATLATLAGEPITATLTGTVVTLTSATGNKSYVEVADVHQANGTIQVVNGVLIPTLP